MNRRSFIGNSCLLCIGAGSGALASLFGGCGSIQTYDADLRDGLMRIPRKLLSDAPLIVRSDELGYDIGLSVSKSGEVRALALVCTHFANRLTSSGNGFSCAAHGSRFDAGGAVTRGPASRPLRTLRAILSGDEVLVYPDS